MAISRRGFLFTTVAVIFVTAIVIYVSAQERIYPRTLSQTNRVLVMDAYLENLEEDLPRAAYIACFRSLIAMEEYIATTGTFTTDFDGMFTSLFTNGTINGTAYGIMNQSSFVDFTQRFSTIAARQGMSANLTVLAVNASQSDPWFVDLVATVHIQLRDTATSVSWNRTVQITSRVPITDIKDPLYSVGTQGRAPHVVRQGNITPPYVGAGNDTTPLQQILNNSWYIATSVAPSFLQRFSGDLSSDPNGIMSFVDVTELRAQDIIVDSCKSVADYVFFGPANSDPNKYLAGMDPNIFWLDDGTIAAIGAGGAVSGSAPCP